jgi:hypothetical protein
MTSFENPLQTLRALKGCPISVLLALIVARNLQVAPIGQEWIERATGYTDKPVSQALTLLEDYGLVTRTSRYGWQLTGAALALPLMATAALPTMAEKSEADGSDEGSRKDSDSENIRVPRSSSIKQDSITRKDLPLESSDPENLRNLAECDQEGIREPARSEISKQAGVTPEVIRYHCRTSQTLGQAIWRIKHNWPIREQIELDFEDDPPEPIRVASEDQAYFGEAVSAIQGNFAAAEYKTWVESCLLLSVEDDVYTVGTGNRVGLDWLERHEVGAMLSAVLGDITQRPIAVQFVIA